MFAMDARLALLVLLPYPLFVYSRARSAAPCTAATWPCRWASPTCRASSRRPISGISVVKAYAMEDTTRRRFAALADDLYHRQLRVVRVNGAMPAITGLLPDARHVGRVLAGRPRHPERHDERGPVLRLLDVHLRAHLPDLHHGLGVHAGAARHRLHGAHRRGAVARCRPSATTRRRAVRELAGEIELRRLTFTYPGPDGPRAGASRRLAARSGRHGARHRRPGRRRQDHARLADPAPLTRWTTAWCSWTAWT